MIEMKDFVAQSINQILTGINNARNDSQYGGDVAPVLENGARIDPSYQVAWHDGHFWTAVHFDLAITARTVTEGGGKVGFKIPIVEFHMKAGGDREKTSEGVSRVQFSVPLRIPKDARR